MPWRLIISLRVVGLIRSISAACLCTPPVAASVRSINCVSKAATTSRNESPSGGITNWGIWNGRGVRTPSGMSSGPIREPVASTTARSMTFSSSRTLPGQ